MSYGNLHSRESLEYLTFISSLQISVNERVGQPYQTARAGIVNEPSITRPNRHMNRPRLSHMCIRAYGGVVPSGRSGGANVVMMRCPSLGKDLAVDAVQVGDGQERRDVEDVVEPPADDRENHAGVA